MEDLYPSDSTIRSNDPPNEHQQAAVLGRPEAVGGAVAAEDLPAGVAVVDAAGHVDDLASRSAHDADVDAAIVVAVDDHDVGEGMGVGRRQDDLVEAFEGDAVFNLDDELHIGGEPSDDDPGVHGPGLLDRLGHELEPAGPGVPAAGEHGRLPADAAEELPTDLAQQQALALLLGDDAGVGGSP